MDQAHARRQGADERPGAGARWLLDDAPAPRPELRLVEYADRDPRTGRRTVQITGQAAAPRVRRSPASAQIAARPDRVAMWAFMLGLVMVVMAVLTAS